MSGKRRPDEEGDHVRPEIARAAIDAEDDGMGEFEDPWEDEIEEESEGEGEGDEGADDGEGTAMETDDRPAQAQVYLPGQQLQPGEVLEHDSSAYYMLHAVNVEWPCLSFDIIADSLGNGRTKVRRLKMETRLVHVLRPTELCRAVSAHGLHSRGHAGRRPTEQQADGAKDVATVQDAPGRRQWWASRRGLHCGGCEF
eukprot:Opistho-1_new@37280